MIINDRVYGKININEPVLLELLASKPLQRLKGIKQSLSNKNVSRYEHSVGVMLLLRKMGADLDEQIAGLMHDVPHTAFSHVIDFVFLSSDYSHEFHEKFYEDIVKNSEIPKILAKYNYNLEKILDENNFPLLERKIPDLCADRLDYSLRDRMGYGENPANISKYLKALVVKGHEIIFNNKDLAYQFAKDYLEMDYKYWSSPREVALYQILADALKIALANKIISHDDLFQDDNFVYRKLKNSKNKQILELLKKIGSNLKIEDNKADYDFHSRNKLRFVDPKFVDAYGSVKRVTDVFPDFTDDLVQHQQWVEAGNYIKIVDY